MRGVLFACAVMASAVAAQVVVARIAVAQDDVSTERWLEPRDIPAAVAAAPGGATPGISLCTFDAWATAKAPAPLTAAPQAGAAVVATLPAERAEADTAIGPEFQVIASANGFFLVRGIYWAGYDGDEQNIAAGPAWMPADLAAFQVWSPNLRTEPRDAAPNVVTMSSDAGAASEWGPSDAAVTKVHGCSGSYVDVDVTLPDGRQFRGWATDLCGNQVTTCGGGGVPIEARDGGLYMPAVACAQEAPGHPLCPPAGAAK